MPLDSNGCSFSRFGRIRTGERRQPAAARLGTAKQPHELLETICTLIGGTRSNVVYDFSAAGLHRPVILESWLHVIHII